MIGKFSIQRLNSKWAIIGFLVFFLYGCVSLPDPEVSQVHQSDTLFTLPGDGSAWIGQSFISRRPRLNSITVFLKEENKTPTPSLIIAELFHSPLDEDPLFSITLNASPNGLRISIPALPDPEGQMYFIKLLARGNDIQVMGRAEDLYPYGVVYTQEGAIPADLAFTTTYDYDLKAFGLDLSSALSSANLIIPLLVVFLFPGSFLLGLILPTSKFDLSEIAGLSIGLSLAVIPLLMLWTGIVGLRWQLNVVQIGAWVLLIGFILVVWLRKPQLNWHINWYDLCLLLVFAVSLTIRLIMIRDMSGTAWVDSVHHGLVTRLILENGHLPTSFEPYFSINPTDYHPGFHAALAVFTWLSKLEMDKSMLLYGQVLNSFAVLAAYLFTNTLTRSPVASLAAALVVGLCTPMPAYYTTWGRYTQLAGTIILPLPFALFNHGLNQTRSTWRYMLLASLAASGLFLVHYRVMAFLVLLLGIYYLVEYVLNKENWSLLLRTCAYGLVCILLISLFALPWLLPTLTKTIAPRLAGEATSKWFIDFSWRYLNTALGQLALALAAISLIFGLLMRYKFVITIVIWCTGLFLLANPTKLGLSSVLLNNTSVAIFLFLPIATLAGLSIDLFERATASILPDLQRPFRVGLMVSGMIIAITGTLRLLPILNAGTILLRQADLPAIEWAADNLPRDALVTINPFLWGYGLYAGSDGGYWLTPIAGLRTLPPPVLGSMGNFEEYNRLSQQVYQLARDPDSLAKLLLSKDSNYVFLGARGGIISPLLLQSNGHYKVIYQENGVWIFHIEP